MATLYANYLGTTGIPAVGDQQQGSRSDRGQIRYIDVLYTMLGTETTNDTIRIAKLYAGEKVLGQFSDVDVEVDLAGASTTLNIGDDDGSGDADRYATLLAVAAVGRVAFDELHFTAEKIITEDCWLTAAFAVLNTPIAGGKIRFRVAVRMP